MKYLILFLFLISCQNDNIEVVGGILYNTDDYSYMEGIYKGMFVNKYFLAKIRCPRYETGEQGIFIISKKDICYEE